MGNGVGRLVVGNGVGLGVGLRVGNGVGLRVVGNGVGLRVGSGVRQTIKVFFVFCFFY